MNVVEVGARIRITAPIFAPSHFFIGSQTFCPRTKCPSGHFVPGQYVSWDTLSPFLTIFWCGPVRHIVPADILSQYKKETKCPSTHIVPGQNVSLEFCY